MKFLLAAALLVLCSLSRADPVEQRDELWCRYRGPSHGRASVDRAPEPPFELAWSVDLWDPNDNGILNDHMLFDTRGQLESGSPWGLGIAWRADRDFLYAFETGFYGSGRGMALFDRRSGEFLGRTIDESAQAVANKRAFSIHDDPGLGAPLVFHGNFYSGQTFFTVADRKLAALEIAEPRPGFGGHACEGPRWLTRGLYLDGAGVNFTDGPGYRWGSNLRLWEQGKESETLLKDLSVPSAAWNDKDLVLFGRGGLTEPTKRGTFQWQEYIRVSLAGAKPAVVGRRRVTDYKAPTGEFLFEDPVPPEAEGARMLNRARSTVHALAISADGRWVYCQERRTANMQRIVRRSLEDFGIQGVILPDDLPLVSEQGFAAQVNVELGIGFCVDKRRFYLHLADRLIAYSLDLSRRLYEIALPKRTLDAHTPFALSRMVAWNNLAYGCRGAENTIATDGRHLFLTTDTTFQVHSCASGKPVWSHTFKRLPALERTFSRNNKLVEVRHYGLPGDVILTDDAVYVATHRNQSMIFCFKRKP